jgi:Zn-finger protein
MVEHFRRKRWTGTRFDLFLNHKQRFRFFPWDCEECRFLHDNEIHRYFRKLWEGTFDRKSTLPVKFDYTLGTTWTYDDDIHSDISEFVDVYIAGTGGPAENRERGAELARAGRQIWSCTRCGTISDPPRATAYTPLLMWMRSLQGFMPAWASMSWGGDTWHETPDRGGTTFFYPGAEFGTEDTYPSLRAKLLRNQLQWVDAMEAAGRRLGTGRVRARVNAVLGTRPAQWFINKDRRKSADWGSEERPVSGWKDVPTATFRRLRALAATLDAGR